MIRFLLILLVFAGGCGPHYVDYFPFHDDGTPKPHIALIPMIDSSESCVPWSISEEFTKSVHYKLMQSGKLYLLSPQELSVDLVKIGNTDVFDHDLRWAKCFCNSDYIVALELIEHDVVPNNDIVNCSYPSTSVLVMKMRIKIIDVRCETPRIVLHEIMRSNYLIPLQKNDVDYEKVCWGSNDFSKTPYGIAHRKMIQDIAQRLEEITGVR